MPVSRIDSTACSQCGICCDVCPMDVIQMINGEPVIVYPEDCMTCLFCEVECPEGALQFDFTRIRRGWIMSSHIA